MCEFCFDVMLSEWHVDKRYMLYDSIEVLSASCYQCLSLPLFLHTSN